MSGKAAFLSALFSQRKQHLYSPPQHLEFFKLFSFQVPRFPHVAACFSCSSLPPQLEGDGYGLSKWAAERLVAAAFAEGLSGCIVRMGNVGWHSSTGAHNPNDFQTMLLKGCALLNTAPAMR